MTAAAKPESTALAPTEKKSAVVALLDTDAARSVIQPLLARGADYARVMQEVYLAVRENPEILTCTRESIVRAVAKAVAWDLVIGETVHLVPFNVKVSRRGEPDAWEKRLRAVQDFKGKIELIVRSGTARSIDAECVYEGEFFELELGSHPTLRHRPETDASKRGPMLGAYAVAHLRFNAVMIKWLPVTEIDEIRATYSKQWKAGELEPWYARKTAVHQLAKMLPKNTRLAQALKAFEEEELELTELDAPGPVAITPKPAGTMSHTLPDERRGPRPLTTAGTDGYETVPGTVAGPGGSALEGAQDELDF